MTSAAEIFYSFPRVIDLSLDRMKAALNKLLLDEKSQKLNLPPIIHIAGTNGKGSTLAFLRAILEAAGKTCHVYTSPHLVTIHERYIIAGKMIGEEELAKYAQMVKELSKDIPLTIFEAETLAGFIAFSQNKADYLLLETGLGGRLDATNAIDDKRLTIIAPVDYDHKEFLGDDLAQIAREKCGILRENIDVVVARQRDVALEAIIDEAKELNCKTHIFGQDWDAYASYGNLCVQNESQLLDLPTPSLKGAHQYENAGTAVISALLLGIDEEAISQGVKSAKWPARMQPLTNGPLAEIAKEHNSELWLDGGHNPHGANAAAAFINSLQNKDKKEFVLICGLLNNKDHNGFFEIFSKLNPETYCVPIKSTPNFETPENLVKLAKSYNIEAFAANNVISALKEATKDKNNVRILICGSLYLAGEILANNN